MSSTSTKSSRLLAPHWRLLNWLRNNDPGYRPDYRCTVADAMTQQGIISSDLVELEARGLIQHQVGTVPVSLAEHYGGAMSASRGWGITLSLTPAGARLVLSDPFNLVLRTLAAHGRPLQVRHVLSEAQVGEEVLRQMGEQRLIDATEGAVALTSFRKLPPLLPVGLAKRGRARVPFGWR